MTKINELIEGSLRCFAYGLIGLLPVIGIPMAVFSAFQYSRVKRGQGEMWNPAQRYLFHRRRLRTDEFGAVFRGGGGGGGGLVVLIPGLYVKWPFGRVLCIFACPLAIIETP